MSVSAPPPPPVSTGAKPAPVAPRQRVTKRVKMIDRIADLLIRSGGVGIIIIVALIFVFIGAETVPLFRAAEQYVRYTAPLPGGATPSQVLAFGVDEYESHAYFVDSEAGAVRFFDVAARKLDAEFPLTRLEGARATTAYRTPARDKLFIGTSDGALLIAEANFAISYDSQTARSVKAGFEELARISLPVEGVAVTRVHGRQNSTGDFFYAAATEDGRLFTGKFIEDEPADDPLPVGGEFEGRITSLIVDYEGNRLFVATDARKLYQYYLDENRDAPFKVYDLDANITALDFAIGDVALLIGLESGAVESWFGVRAGATDVFKPIQRVHSFEPLPAAVTCIQPSARDKGFVAGAADGTVKLYFTTSERTLLTDKLDAGVHVVAYAPKLTALLSLSAAGSVRYTWIDNPHPEISGKVLFGKVHYEGYDEPDYIWQSTGGTDDFEAKFSLVPLTVGTLKAAFYGLLFAIPVAVFAALYVSQFMTPSLRGYVKPTVEIMAALPSVVIGFLAGLWLAPRLEVVMVGTMLAAVGIPLTVLIGGALWMMLPRGARTRLPPGTELWLLMPLVLLGFWLSQQAGPVVEAAFFGGNYKQWVFDTFGEQFEQRNSIVIGVTLGFAVIPIIFTISEDAFSNVPQAFKSASYALGASRWQTAWRVIVPTASPGVFSAIMIGFGRAVGETMIVLMATGNTPIMSFSPFNGMRTLSANIAVEIPEAPVAGTLYRVLFVAALLLFALTFIVNTIAEVIRQRLRQKYQAV
jgi:phosphate transport system permease protein